MNLRDGFQFYWSDNRYERPPDGWDQISEHDFLEVKGRTESVAEPGDQSPSWAQDLLLIARAAYVADRKALRSRGDDGWTRSIRISVPLWVPDPWNIGPAKHLLRDLLTTLTGDRWDIHLRSGGRGNPKQGRLVDNWRAADVALLSGGLDSTAFAAWMARRARGAVLFVVFYDPHTKHRQAETVDQISALWGHPIHRRQISQTVLGHGSFLEPSSRSRGLLYMATAVYAAAAHSARTVLVPENGQLAVNLPLSPSRAGACSTRSVHPRTLSLLNSLIARAGGDITVMNPFSDRTKGEVCLRGRDAGLTPETLFRTVSCSHPPVKRRGQAPYHCGYCYPCLVRRAGLWHALHGDRTRYQHDPWNLRYKDPKAEDLRALQRWLCIPLAVRDLIIDVPLPPGVTPASLMPVQRRARQELSTMLGAVLPVDSDFRRNWQPVP
jgi:7-cyano-7-deazaguanine synthase in queuosine biosynthesis